MCYFGESPPTEDDIKADIRNLLVRNCESRLHLTPTEIARLKAWCEYERYVTKEPGSVKYIPASD